MAVIEQASGFEPVWLNRPPPRSAGRGLGGLCVPDLDAPPPDPAADAARAEAEAAAEAALVAAREAGEAAGHAAGLAEAAAGQQAAIARALQHIAAALPGLDAAARDAGWEAGEALAGMLLAALRAALPAAAARLAPESAAALAEVLRPVLATAPALTLFVAAGLGPACEVHLARCLEDNPRLSLREDAALAPGDTRAEWQGGAAVAALAAQWEAVAATLAALGLRESQ